MSSIGTSQSSLLEQSSPLMASVVAPVTEPPSPKNSLLSPSPFLQSSPLVSSPVISSIAVTSLFSSSNEAPIKTSFDTSLSSTNSLRSTTVQIDAVSSPIVSFSVETSILSSFTTVPPTSSVNFPTVILPTVISPSLPASSRISSFVDTSPSTNASPVSESISVFLQSPTVKSNPSTGNEVSRSSPISCPARCWGKCIPYGYICCGDSSLTAWSCNQNSICGDSSGSCVANIVKVSPISNPGLSISSPIVLKPTATKQLEIRCQESFSVCGQGCMPANSTCCDSMTGYCPEYYYCANAVEGGEQCFRSELGPRDPNSLPQLNVIKVADQVPAPLPLGQIIGVFLAGVIILAGFIIAVVYIRRKNVIHKAGYASTTAGNSTESTLTQTRDVLSQDDSSPNGIVHVEEPYQPQSRSSYYDHQQEMFIPIATPVVTPVPIGGAQYVYFPNNQIPIQEQVFYTTQSDGSGYDSSHRSESNSIRYFQYPASTSGYVSVAANRRNIYNMD